MIAAILRAQWLSMRLGSSRGQVLGVITAVIWYGLWTAAAVAVGIAAATAGATALRLWLPIGFLAVFAYWQLAPVLSASMGASLDLRKLLLFPVPHRKLFLIEVLLRLTSALEMVLILVGGAAGLLANPNAGGLRAVPRVAATAAVFTLFNLLTASGLRSVIERILARRRVREVMVVLLTMLWVLPRLLVELGVMPKLFQGAGDGVRAIVYPWASAAHAWLGDATLPGLLLLCAWTLVAWWFGRSQFERSLRYDPIAAQATRLDPAAPARSRMDRLYRLPSLFLRDPLACLVEKELRSLARTPRFRMVFVMGFTFGLMVWFPLMAGRRAHSSAASPYFLIVVCIYALTLLGQVSYWNCLGFDRSAAAFYFASPQPFRKVLVGKNLASLCFVYLEVAILIGVTAALRLNRGWATGLETLVVVGICALYMLALGNLSSVQYPRGLNPERVSQGGASGRFQGLLFLFYPVALVPVVLAYLARYAFNSQLVFAIGLGIAAAIGGVLYWTALESAAGTATARREQIVHDLSQSDGPVASN